MNLKENLIDNNQGFTLLELMVVVVIIGIVGTMVSPQLINVANETSLKSDIQAAQSLQNMIDMHLANGNTFKNDDIATICADLKEAGYLSDKDLEEGTLKLRLGDNKLTYSPETGVQLQVDSNYTKLAENLDSILRGWTNVKSSSD